MHFRRVDVPGMFWLTRQCQTDALDGRVRIGARAMVAIFFYGRGDGEKYGLRHSLDVSFQVFWITGRIASSHHLSRVRVTF